MHRLFGTDGIRGKANNYPITPEVALKLGKAIAKILEADRKGMVGSRRAIIGKDTRRSCYMIESALEAGLVSMGMHVYLVGPIPTPAIAYLTRSMLCDCGIMITASHNLSDDNGIKLFDRHGQKFRDEKIQELEKLLLGPELEATHVRNEYIGEAERIEDARGRYIAYAKSTVPDLSLFGKTIVLDCANGAAYRVAPAVFEELGAEVISINIHPDGLNINDGCGAINPETVKMSVNMHNADIGIALDGDADRVVFCDERGEVVNGDQIIAICAIDLKERMGRVLTNDTLVVTEMSNMGLFKEMERHQINVEVTEVGDHRVIERMRYVGSNFGGEESGHLIFSDLNTTGDGIISALQILQIMEFSDRPLSQLDGRFKPHPRCMINLPVSTKRPIQDMPVVQKTLVACHETLADRGRHLVRYSGTEDKLRILVESESQDEADEWASNIAMAFKKEIGTT